MRKIILTLGIVFCCFFVLSTTKASDLYDNYFNSSEAPTSNPWFQKVWDNYSPNLGDTVKVRMKLVNGVNEISGAKVRIYHLGDFAQIESDVSCIVWDLSGAKLLKEINLPKLSAGQYLTQETSFLVDPLIFKTGAKSTDINNVVFEVYSPNNNIGLECNYSNLPFNIESSGVDLQVDNITITPVSPTMNTPITIKYTVKNNGDEKFINENASVGIERKELNGNYTGAPAKWNLIGEIIPGQTKEYSFVLDPKVGLYPWNNGVNDSLAVGVNRMRLAIRDNYSVKQSNYNNDEVIFNLNIGGGTQVQPINTTETVKTTVVEATKTTQSNLTLTNGTLFKSSSHTSVYYYENNTRRPFVNSAVFYTWFNNFNDVKNLTVAQVEAIKLGQPMPIKVGTKLLKFPINPKVYEVIDGNRIKHIPDEATAITKFGKNWAKNVIELPEIYYLFYEDIS